LPAAPTTTSAATASVLNVQQVTLGTATSTPTSAASTAPTSTKASGETALDVGAEQGGGSLVTQASRALSRGQTGKAVELARKATVSAPADADAWLTLGAALQASGNASAARDAYASCVAQAKTANVSECRVLAGR
jgi:Flp pilus assembly protein TadD